VSRETASAPGTRAFTNPATNGGSAIANGFIVIGNNSNFEFWAPFSQSEDVLLAPNQTATVTVDALPGLSLPAVVKVIEPSAIQVGGVPEYYADIALTASDAKLRSGQTGSVNVVIANCGQRPLSSIDSAVHRYERRAAGRCLVRRSGVSDHGHYRGCGHQVDTDHVRVGPGRAGRPVAGGADFAPDCLIAVSIVTNLAH